MSARPEGTDGSDHEFRELIAEGIYFEDRHHGLICTAS